MSNFSKRDDLIIDVLLKMATDTNIPVEQRTEMAMALARDKASRDQYRHEKDLEKIKRSAPKQRITQPNEHTVNVPEVTVDPRPLGEQVDEALKAFENSQSEVGNASN